MSNAIKNYNFCKIVTYSNVKTANISGSGVSWPPATIPGDAKGSDSVDSRRIPTSAPYIPLISPVGFCRKLWLRLKNSIIVPMNMDSFEFCNVCEYVRRILKIRQILRMIPPIFINDQVSTSNSRKEVCFEHVKSIED